MAISTIEQLLPPRGSSYTMAQLKAAYRAACHVVHPDHGGSSEDFIRLRKLFKAMIASASDERAEREAMTTNGRPLSEFGRGLGVNKNGRECDHCSGVGYGSTHTAEYVRCKVCNPHGSTLYGDPYCRQCRGLGEIRIVPKGGSNRYHDPQDSRRGYLLLHPSLPSLQGTAVSQDTTK